MPLAYQAPMNPSLRFANYLGIGLGDTQTVEAVAGTAATVASANTAAIASTLGVAIPVVGAAIAGVFLAVSLWLNRKGPKQKEATTRFVNDAEPILVQNLAAFMNGARTQADKDFALAVFDKVWGEVVAACSQASMGNPGEACIADRRAGACEWKEGGGMLELVCGVS